MLKAIDLINKHMTEPAVIHCGGLCVSYFVRRNPTNPHTEDSAGIFVLDDQVAVIAVADGFGGQKSGEVASRMAIETLAGNLVPDDPAIPLRERISRSFEMANDAILGLGNGAATTFVVCEIDHAKIRFYNAGDSVGLLYGGRGKRKLATIEHNPVGLGRESGLVSGTEKRLEDVKHLVSNYLGSKELRIEITAQKPVAVRDRVLVASDGVTDNFDMDKMVLESPHAMCSSLAEQVSTRIDSGNGKVDDVALIVAAYA